MKDALKSLQLETLLVILKGVAKERGYDRVTLCIAHKYLENAVKLGRGEANCEFALGPQPSCKAAVISAICTLIYVKKEGEDGPHEQTD